MAHIDEIKNYVENNDLEILAFTEARITSDINDFELQIKGYSHVRCNSENRYTGAVICYVKDYVNYEVRLNISTDKVLWLLAIEVKKCLIVIVYRSPSSSVAEFLVHMERIVEDIQALCNENIYIMGDLNIDVGVSSFYEDKLIKLMKNIGLSQKVKDYTRITEISKSIIDLVFTNDEEAQVEVRRTPKITDHDIISLAVIKSRQMNNSNKETYYYKFRDLKKIDERNIVQILSGKKWSNGEIDHRLDVFNKNIISAIDEIAPIQTRQSKKLMNKWFDEETKLLIKRRDFAYNQASLQSTEERWSIYKELRNLVTTTIRRKKKLYYENLIDQNKNNSKAMWKAIKEVLGNKGKNNTISEIFFGNSLVNEEEQIAERFNEYFVTSIEEIVKNKKQNETFTANQLEIEETNLQLDNFRHITIDDIKKIIKTLRKDNSIDGIDKKIIKFGMPVIGNELMNIINKSIDEGKVPNKWKGSLVIPVPKVINTKICEEHRPINMLPISEKIMEVFIKEQILDHVKVNNILIPNQSGFRDKHSCESSIQLVVSRWKELIDQGKTILTVFIDFKRAFETIDRKKLTNKLAKYGIVENANKWVDDYLSNRYQQTKIGERISSKKQVNFGVPQGTVLGPLLFILYINNIVSCLDRSTIINLFADDTAITVFGEGEEEVRVKMQAELKSLEVWLSSNNLFVNTQKTKVMLFNKKNFENINKLELFGEQLEYVVECKYLGLIIDNQLKFSKHADYVIDKVNKKINFFRRLSNNLSMYSRVTVYKSIIAPHFDYCPTILFYLNETEKNRLQKIQNRAMRVILKVNRYVRIRDMLECLQFMNIDQRLVYQNLLFIFKMIHNLLPEYMAEKITFVNDIHNYNTRNAGDIYVPTAKKTSTQNSLFHKGLVIYNSLPQHIKTINSLNIFKRNISQYVKNNY